MTPGLLVLIFVLLVVTFQPVSPRLIEWRTFGRVEPHDVAFGGLFLAWTAAAIREAQDSNTTGYQIASGVVIAGLWLLQRQACLDALGVQLIAWFLVGLASLEALRQLVAGPREGAPISPVTLFMLVGIDFSRWQGPFGSLTAAAACAILLVAVGVYARMSRPSRWALTASGLALAVLSESRAGLAACVAMVLLRAACGARHLVARILSTILVVVIAIAAFALRGFNGRLEIWREYLQESLAAFPWGIGTAGVVNASWSVAGAGQAHNAFLESFVRYGVLSLMGIALFFVGCLWSAWLVRGISLGPFMLTLAIATLAAVDVVVDPRFMGVELAVMLAGQWWARSLRAEGRSTSDHQQAF